MRLANKKGTKIAQKVKKVSLNSKDIKKTLPKQLVKNNIMNKISAFSSSKSYESTDESDREIDEVPYVYLNFKFFY